jgi:hypothetical protein
MVQTAADVIKAIDNKAAAGESIVSRAGTSSPMAIREQTGFIITTERPVTIGLKSNTDMARVKRQGTEIDINNVIA